MPTRSQVRAPILERLTVDVGNGSSLNVTFDKLAVTTEWARRLDDAASSGDVMAAAEGLAQVITVWDLTEDDGTPVAPTASELALLSLGTLDSLGTQLVDAAKPGAAEKNVLSASSAGSTAAAGVSEQVLPIFPDGVATSPSPESSASLSPT